MNHQSQSILTQSINLIIHLEKKIPNKIKDFYLKSGIPEIIIDELPRLISEVKYKTCFISYGNPDKEFAEKLVEELRSNGVSCWLYSLDYIVGQKTWREISQKRKEADKMIILCSMNSLTRPGVKKEIEDQIIEDEDKLVPISLDTSWQNPNFDVKTDTMDLKPFLLQRNYCDFSQKSEFKTSVIKLLKGLRTDN